MYKVVTSVYMAAIMAVGVVFPASAEEPGAFLLRVSDEVLSLVEEARTVESDQEAFLRQELVTRLDPYVDFHAFAKGVMGKHSKNIEAKTVEAFKISLRDTMVRLYAKAMLAFDVKKMELTSTTEPRPNVAQVAMLITSGEGATFSAQYNLRNIKGDWKVRNVILDGVNLGLTYRNQFYSAVQGTQGDVLAAVNGWADLQEGKDVTVVAEK